MAIQNTMKLINEYPKHWDSRYSLCFNNIQDIYESEDDPFSMIMRGFEFGFMQGRKAALAEVKKGGAA